VAAARKSRYDEFHSEGVLHTVEYKHFEVRVGTDVQSVADVEDAITRFGEHYLWRLYTDHEVASCGGPTTRAAPGLSARFAAKEAMLKLLRPEKVVPGWRDIEVRRHPAGWCSMSLQGVAAELAEQAGVQQLSVSLSHDAGVATATVVGVCETSPAQTKGVGAWPASE
jgi:holo-[acyl-carrier protein] synthase